jgi:hypothetical protein
MLYVSNPLILDKTSSVHTCTSIQYASYLLGRTEYSVHSYQIVLEIVSDLVPRAGFPLSSLQFPCFCRFDLGLILGFIVRHVPSTNLSTVVYLGRYTGVEYIVPHTRQII